MGEAIKILVSLEADLKPELAEAVLGVEPAVQIIGMSEDLEGRWNTATEQAADLLMVACGGYSQRALTFIDRTVKENPGRPVVVLAEGPVNGFVKRVFEAGADDILTLPVTDLGTDRATATAQILFMLEKAVARKRGSFSPTRSAGSKGSAPSSSSTAAARCSIPSSTRWRSSSRISKTSSSGIAISKRSRWRPCVTWRSRRE